MCVHDIVCSCAHGELAKWTEEVLDVISNYLFWKCQVEDMFSRHITYMYVCCIHQICIT